MIASVTLTSNMEIWKMKEGRLISVRLHTIIFESIELQNEGKKAYEFHSIRVFDLFLLFVETYLICINKLDRLTV